MIVTAESTTKNFTGSRNLSNFGINEINEIQFTVILSMKPCINEALQLVIPAGGHPCRWSYLQGIIPAGGHP
jgi:hypothetical protein